MEKAKIEIQFDHRSVQDSEALVAYANPKLEHACAHGRVLKVSLTCRVQDAGNAHQIDAVVHMPKRYVVGVRASSRDMYQTVDLIVPKIEKVVRKHTEILHDFSHDSPCRSKSYFEADGDRKAG
jgi:ribosomal subunit interface protein